MIMEALIEEHLEEATVQILMAIGRIQAIPREDSDRLLDVLKQALDHILDVRETIRGATP